jgi:prevent-host-death family protein
MTRHVPISEFKDHASELVAAAERGEEIVITRHGRPAARLAPLSVDDAERRRRVTAALERAAERREQMRAEGRTVTMEEIIAWKNEGRR